MNTMEDLRATLAQHSGDLHDETGTAARVGAVRSRARAVRRRRAAAVGVAAVLAVLGVGLVGTLGPEPAQPAGRTLGDEVAPRTLTSLGYDFRFTRGVQSEDGDERLELRLAPSDRPRLVSWSGSEGARLTGAGQQLGGRGTLTGPGFDDFTLVEPGEPFRGRLRDPDGDPMAFAVYDLASAAPGITRDGVTLREQVAGAELLGGEIGAPGDGEVSARVRLPEGNLSLATVCRAPEGTELTTLVDGIRIGAEPCTGQPQWDLTPSSTMGSDLGREYGPGSPLAGVDPGDEVTITVRAHRRGESAPITGSDVRVGIGAYAAAESATGLPGRLAGTVPEYVELDGRLWRLADAPMTGRGEQEVSVDLDREEPVLLGSFGSTSELGARVVTTVDGAEVGGMGGSYGGPWATQEGVLRPGTGTYAARWAGQTPADGVLGISVYERVE